MPYDTCAVDVATEAAGEKSVTGCFLTRIEAANAIFELRSSRQTWPIAMLFVRRSWPSWRNAS